MKSLAHPQDAADLLTRLAKLRPDNVRRWGRMSAHQAVCHMRDAFLMGTSEKPVSDVATWSNRTLMKWIALYGPLRWPAGIATRPEVDQLEGGTRPAAFEADVSMLAELITRIASDARFFHGRRHPIFGPLSDAAWMRWGYLHVDHHLRQFGV